MEAPKKWEQWLQCMLVALVIIPVSAWFSATSTDYLIMERPTFGQWMLRLLIGYAVIIAVGVAGGVAVVAAARRCVKLFTR